MLIQSHEYSIVFKKKVEKVEMDKYICPFGEIPDKY